MEVAPHYALLTLLTLLTWLTLMAWFTIQTLHSVIKACTPVYISCMESLYNLTIWFTLCILHLVKISPLIKYIEAFPSITQVL